jgi:hypothetical protein
LIQYYPTMSRDTDKIVRSHADGYRGIMPLDIDAIPPQFQKNAIERHIKDIEEYKKDQLERPERMRYENTIERIERIHRIDDAAAEKRHADAIKVQTIHDNKMSDSRRNYEEREKLIMQIALTKDQKTP